MRNRDALLTVLLVACGGNGPNTIDTIDAPAQVDASAVDATPVDADEATRVDVTAYTFTGDGSVDPTAIAIFSDAAGTVIQHGMVDANGRAHGYLPQGGTVTVLQVQDDPTNLFNRSDRLTTIRGVKPGDQLIAGRTQTGVMRSGSIDVMHASFTSINNSAGPALLTACAEPGLGNPKPLVFYASCATPTFDLLSVADDQSTNVRKYIWQEAIPYVPGGAFTIPNAWQPMPQTSTMLLDVPSNTGRIGMTLYAVLGGVPIEVDERVIELPPAGSNSVSLLYAPITAPTAVVAQMIRGEGLERYAVVTNGSPGGVEIDYASLVVPTVTNVKQSTSGITWAQNAAGAPDARSLTWSAQWTDSNNVTHFAGWEILDAPDAATSLELPMLPDAYAADDPTRHAAELQLRGATVRYFDYDNLAGYDAAKPYGPELVWVEQQFLSIDHRARVSFATN